ncbi:MAG: hypothetical protein K6G50_02795 [bacterium]|nr:hypothetical protein [bacterium]
MKKEDAVRIITECAKQYHKNLAGKNVLFLFGSSQKQDYFEVSFLPRNYLHLTGVKLVGNSVSAFEGAFGGVAAPAAVHHVVGIFSRMVDLAFFNK